MADDDLVVYTFHGNEGEVVPTNVQKLIVSEGVQVLPERLCYQCDRLQEVRIPSGVVRIEKEAFAWCKSLLEVQICNTVEYIGKNAFFQCERLKKLDFDELPTSSGTSRHKLQIIERRAFAFCNCLQKVELPSSVTSVGADAFRSFLGALVEANLSATSVTVIPEYAFFYCVRLKTVRLPNTVERIADRAFSACDLLATVLVPIGTKAIRIGSLSFPCQYGLEIFALPQGSSAEADSFQGCDSLERAYGKNSSLIVAGLIRRFENLPIHKMCYYDQNSITARNLKQCLMEHEKISLVDDFGMTPFHLLFLTGSPRLELIMTLLEILPIPNTDCRFLILECLLRNYFASFQQALRKWIIDPLTNWGAREWATKIKHLVGELIFERDYSKRRMLLGHIDSLFNHHGNVQATSILEMALWKAKLKSGRTSDGARRRALDREECRCVNGSDIVIPLVVAFLDIQGTLPCRESHARETSSPAYSEDDASLSSIGVVADNHLTDEQQEEVDRCFEQIMESRNRR